MTTKIAGVKAKHAIVTPVCQANKSTIGAGHEAIMRLMDEYRKLAGLEVNQNANFHFVLTVERPVRDGALLEELSSQFEEM